MLKFIFFFSLCDCFFFHINGGLNRNSKDKVFTGILDTRQVSRDGVWEKQWLRQPFGTLSSHLLSHPDPTIKAASACSDNMRLKTPQRQSVRWVSPVFTFLMEHRLIENVQKRNMNPISQVIRNHWPFSNQREFRVGQTLGFHVNYLRVFFIVS